MKNLSYIPLSVHSAYSLSEGAITIPRLLKFCTQQKMPAVALTDTFNLFGAMEFCLEAITVGIQPIIGVKVWLEMPSFSKDDHFKKNAEQSYLHPLTLLVTDQNSYQNLTKLISWAYRKRHPLKQLFIDQEIIKQLSKGLIALSGKVNFSHFNNIDSLKYKQYLTSSTDLLASIFQNNFYIDICRYGFQEAYQVENDLIAIAQEKGIPLVATNEAYFVDETEYEAHDALLCIANQTVIRDQSRRRLTPHHRLKTSQEMASIFKDLPEALDNTFTIAKRCHFFLEPAKPRLPAFPTKNLEIEELKVQAYQGLEKRLIEQVFPNKNTDHSTESIKEKYYQRLNYEIDIIDKMGYAGYYLIVADFIKWAKSHNIPVGPGRGSGAGSIVAWSLTITDVDPIAFNLLFERFLNPERVSMPDFDIDFCQDKRGLVIDYVCQKYGRDRVAQIITFGKFQARITLRDVGRVMGMPYMKIDGLSKLVPSNPANPLTLSQAIAQEPEIKEAIDRDPETAKLFNTSLQLEGLYRHASTHAAGIVIGDEPLENIVPLYYDAPSENAIDLARIPEPGTGLPATQFSMKYVELAGLVKFDLLGLKTLTVMQETLNLLHKQNISLDLSQIPLNDKKTFDLLCRVETVSIFQLESPGMRDVIRKLQPSNFEEIIALVALYRPGPMDDIPRYIACKHGSETITYLHPKLEPILKETYGVMVYQEQVMQIAQDLAGYSLGQADLLRRAMGKKIAKEMEAQRDHFIKGCNNSGIINQTAVQIFDQMAKFASYGFNKCHSAPYALIAYQTAYLKANYPVEFIAALMTADLHNVDKLTVIREEAHRMGICILPPDINHSFPYFQIEKVIDKKKVSHFDYGIRYALSALKNVGVHAVEIIVRERDKNGPYQSIIDFFCRHDSQVLNKRFIENLTASGGFDCLHTNRAELYMSISKLMTYAFDVKKEKNSTQLSLLESLSSKAAHKTFKWVKVAPWGNTERIKKEFEAIGYYLTEHPLDRYHDIIEPLNVIKFNELEQADLPREGQVVNLAGVILSKKERIDKSGSKYAFIQFSDTTKLYEGSAFSEVYMRCRNFIEPGNVILIKALAKREDETVRLVIHSIKLLDDMINQSYSGTLIINFDNLSVLEELHHLFIHQIVPKGQMQVVFHYSLGDNTVIISLSECYQITPETIDQLDRLSNIKYKINIR